MNLRKVIFTKNQCYLSGKLMTPLGIMVHSTGANNTNLSRYVAPDDGLLGPNKGNNSWNQSTPDGRQVCVHAFIGKLADGTIATYQTLPWNMVGWHSGSGVNGSANSKGYIGFEICEDGLTDSKYFEGVVREAMELCAYLCREFNIDPLGRDRIICHSEGYKLGIASNHADVMHWFPRHGMNMDMFRLGVAGLLRTGEDEMIGDMKLSVNGKPPIIIKSVLKDGLNYPNLRELAAALELVVGYDDATKTVTLRK